MKKHKEEFVIAVSAILMVLLVILTFSYFGVWFVKLSDSALNKLSFFLLAGYFAAILGYTLARLFEHK